MFGIFKSDTVYIRIFTGKVEIRHLEKDRTLVKDAEEKFSNERLLIADFNPLCELIMKALSDLSGSKSFTRTLNIVLQPMEKKEGGLSEVEKMVLRDLGSNIGGKRVFIEESNQSLSDDQLRRLVAE